MFLTLLTTLVVSFYFKTANQLAITHDQTRLSLALLSSKTVKTIVISDILNEISRSATNQVDHGHLYFRTKEPSQAYLSRDSIPADNPLFFVRRSDDGFEGGRIRGLRLDQSTTESTRKSDIVSDDYWKMFLGKNSGIRDAAPRWRYLPSAFSTTNSKRKNSVRFAFRLYQLDGMMDIGGIPMQSEATAKTSDTLFSKINFPNLGLLNTYKWFQWRYPSGKNDTEIVKGSALDSYSMSNKNRILLGRKDFIHFIEEHPAIFSKNLFHLWTHCNIQKNIPTYTPIAIAGSSIDYEKEVLKKEAVNPDFLNIRVQNEFLRRNGQTARPGEPLVTQRFPLQYTLWLDSSAGVEASAEQIEKYFGLKRDSTDEDAWNYRSGQSKILTLDEVAKLNREPDFFELLKAVILKGSIGYIMPLFFEPSVWGGRESGPAVLLTGTPKEPYMSSDAQIIQIGVNIIDQYDTNSYVSRVKFSKDNNGDEMSFYGKEDLPYITSTSMIASRITSPSPNVVQVWLKLAAWFPHDHQFTNSSQKIPTDFKVEVTGQTLFQVQAIFPIPPWYIVKGTPDCGAISIPNIALFKGNHPLPFTPHRALIYCFCNRTQLLLNLFFLYFKMQSLYRRHGCRRDRL